MYIYILFDLKYIFIYIWYKYWHIYICKKNTNLCFFILIPIPSVSLNDWKPGSGFQPIRSEVWTGFTLTSSLAPATCSVASPCFAADFALKGTTTLKQSTVISGGSDETLDISKKKYLQEKNNSNFLIQEETYTDLLNLADFDQWLY